jgi:hypothetical protein
MTKLTYDSWQFKRGSERHINIRFGHYTKRVILFLVCINLRPVVRNCFEDLFEEDESFSLQPDDSDNEKDADKQGTKDNQPGTG